jgi:hypothetical protein
MVKKTKIDYYSVIKRRRRSVGGVLESNNITTKKKLTDFVKSLEGEFIISDTFLSEAKAFIDKLANKKTEAEVVTPVTVDNKTNDTETAVNVTPSKKTTKRKRTNKKKND